MKVSLKKKPQKINLRLKFGTLSIKWLLISVRPEWVARGVTLGILKTGVSSLTHPSHVTPTNVCSRLAWPLRNATVRPRPPNSPPWTGNLRPHVFRPGICPLNPATVGVRMSCTPVPWVPEEQVEDGSKSFLIETLIAIYPNDKTADRNAPGGARVIGFKPAVTILRNCPRWSPASPGEGTVGGLRAVGAMWTFRNKHTPSQVPAPPQTSAYQKIIKSHNNS